jgi:hypothetical protein
MILTQISYGDSGTFKVQAYDQESGENHDYYAIDMVTQFAVDAAFERRVNVSPKADDLDNIIEVKSDEAHDKHVLPLPGNVIITRISTEEQVGRLIAEIFHKSPPEQQEHEGKTKDPVILMLCHSAYALNHPLDMTLDPGGNITAVVKFAGLAT